MTSDFSFNWEYDYLNIHDKHCKQSHHILSQQQKKTCGQFSNSAQTQNHSEWPHKFEQHTGVGLQFQVACKHCTPPKTMIQK